MNATDIERIRRRASSPFWWTRFWLFRGYTLNLCRELERARKALEFEPVDNSKALRSELGRVKDEALKHKTSVMKLLQFIHVHNGIGRMKPTQTPP